MLSTFYFQISKIAALSITMMLPHNVLFILLIDPNRFTSKKMKTTKRLLPHKVLFPNIYLIHAYITTFAGFVTRLCSPTTDFQISQIAALSITMMQCKMVGTVQLICSDISNYLMIFIFRKKAHTFATSFFSRIRIRHATKYSAL